MNLIPIYNIKYKNESLLMRIIGLILFFNPSFMTKFTTTLGHTIYMPSKEWQINNDESSKVLTVHENVHIKDSEKYSSIIFGLSYILPQVMVIPALLLFMLLKPWMVLIIIFLLLLPLPAIFRTMWEKKAYTFSLYTWYLLETKYGANPNYDKVISNIIAYFKSFNYYLMCPWMNKSYFETTLAEFKMGNKPHYNVEYYQMAEELLDKLMA